MNVVNEIEDVLRQEQELLLSGNYAALEALVRRKSGLVKRLSESRPNIPREAYAQLARRASQNEALLGAAQRGLQSALTQLRQLAAAEEQATYSREGKRRVLSRYPSSITEKY